MYFTEFQTSEIKSFYVFLQYHLLFRSQDIQIYFRRAPRCFTVETVITFLYFHQYKSLFLFKNIFFLFLAMLGLCCFLGFSLVSVSRGYAMVAVHRPLIVVASLVEHEPQGARASVVVAHVLSCFKACGILPDQESNPCPLHWQADSPPLRHQRSPLFLGLCTNRIRWVCWAQVAQQL